MSLALAHSLFMTGVGVLMAIWAVLAAVLMVTFLLPKAFIAKFFAPPHFGPNEIHMFSGFPYAYIRTFMFMRLVANPSSGIKRGLQHVHSEAPGWFRVFSKIVLPLFYGLVVSFASLLFVVVAFGPKPA